jgi:pyruvate carboxylase
VLATHDYLYGLKVGVEHVIEMRKGVSLFVTLEAVSEPDGKGIRTVMATLNGQLRPLLIRDTSVAATTATAEKADRANPNHIAAPFLGVVTLQVEVGDVIPPGGTVATIEAMKMEAAITSADGGLVERLVVPTTQQVEQGDLLVVLG